MTDLGNTNYPIHLANMKRAGVEISTDLRLIEVCEDQGGKLVAKLQHEYCYEVEERRDLDLVVVEHGTTPSVELFDELKPLAVNEGVICPTAWQQGCPGRDDRVLSKINPSGKFALFNVGDS